AEGAAVTDARDGAGDGSSGRFYAASNEVLGMQPSNYRAGGQGETIRFAVAECSLGAILVAATERGICASLSGDQPEPLLEDLQARFPRAELRGAEEGFERTVALVIGLV
ncbi:bifunctional transcriptional activator/DNA repair enzyme protein Ada, partial [Listeria monocytogenes]|nr:bifunctional transcriptional activator/DNA repair enzyme protein Ada [Listeria monocytogenes]